MGKVIALKPAASPNPRYDKVLRGAARRLDRTGQALYTAAVNLACHGKWKEWADAQPDGTRFHFESEMLADAGDPNITSLLDALDPMWDALQRLRAAAGPNPKTRRRQPTAAELVEQLLPEASRSAPGEKPRFVVFLDAVGVGKRALPEERLEDLVPLDEAEVTAALHASGIPAGSRAGKLLAGVGAELARRALEERRHVCFTAADDPEVAARLTELLPRINALGYRTKLIGVGSSRGSGTAPAGDRCGEPGAPSSPGRAANVAALDWLELALGKTDAVASRPGGGHDA